MSGTINKPSIIVKDADGKVIETYDEYDPIDNPDGVFYLLELLYKKCDNGNFIGSFPITDNTEIPDISKLDKNRLVDINPVVIVRKEGPKKFNIYNFLDTKIIKNDKINNLPKNDNLTVKKNKIKKIINNLENSDKFDTSNWYEFGYSTALSLTNYIPPKTNLEKELYCYEYFIGNYNNNKHYLRIYIQFNGLPEEIKYTEYVENQEPLCSSKN